MHINITNSETGDNKGSSSRLVNYLEKENRLAEQLDKTAVPEYWFSHNRTGIRPYEVRQAIDNNIGKLSKSDAKFFLVNISPSAKELGFLKEKFGKKVMREQLRLYANEVMDAYAKNFKRAGINGKEDLVYFGKVEQYRYYSYRDAEVREGRAKRGERKPGEQLHVQMIVSRKDVSDSMKLSPLNNSKGKNAAHSAKVGQFDRVAFKQAAESVFDDLFTYRREMKESFAYANAMKHGTYAQKQQMRQRMGEMVSGNLPVDVLSVKTWLKCCWKTAMSGWDRIWILSLKRRERGRRKDSNTGCNLLPVAAGCCIAPALRAGLPCAVRLTGRGGICSCLAKAGDGGRIGLWSLLFSVFIRCVSNIAFGLIINSKPSSSATNLKTPSLLPSKLIPPSS